MKLELASTSSQLARFNPSMTDDLDVAREHISKAKLDGISLICLRHGACVSVRPQLLHDFFLLQLSIRGEAFVTVDQHHAHCHPRQAVMISPKLGMEMKFGELPRETLCHYKWNH